MGGNIFSFLLICVFLFSILAKQPAVRESRHPSTVWLSALWTEREDAHGSDKRGPASTGTLCRPSRGHSLGPQLSLEGSTARVT